jgi:hypothetical protein
MAGNKNNPTRNRKSRIDMSSEAGRLLLKDMINFKESGFNPFDRETILSKRFWKFRLEYGKSPFVLSRHKLSNWQTSQ